VVVHCAHVRGECYSRGVQQSPDASGMVVSRPFYCPYLSGVGCPFVNHNDPGRPVHEVCGQGYDYDYDYDYDQMISSAKCSSLLGHCSASALAEEITKAFCLHPFHRDGGLGVYGHDVGRVLKGFGAEEANY